MLTALYARWAILAELVERAMHLAQNQVLVWALDLMSNEEDFFIYAQLDLCIIGNASHAEVALVCDWDSSSSPIKLQAVLSQKTLPGRVYIRSSWYGDEDAPLNAKAQAEEIVQKLVS